MSLQQTSSVWNTSLRTIDSDGQQSSKQLVTDETNECNERMIPQSSMSTVTMNDRKFL